MYQNPWILNHRCHFKQDREGLKNWLNSCNLTHVSFLPTSISESNLISLNCNSNCVEGCFAYGYFVWHTVAQRKLTLPLVKYFSGNNNFTFLIFHFSRTKMSYYNGSMSDHRCYHTFIHSHRPVNDYVYSVAQRCIPLHRWSISNFFALSTGHYLSSLHTLWHLRHTVPVSFYTRIRGESEVKHTFPCRTLHLIILM